MSTDRCIGTASLRIIDEPVLNIGSLGRYKQINAEWSSLSYDSYRAISYKGNKSKGIEGTISVRKNVVGTA